MYKVWRPGADNKSRIHRKHTCGACRSSLMLHPDRGISLARWRLPRGSMHKPDLQCGCAASFQVQSNLRRMQNVGDAINLRDMTPSRQEHNSDSADCFSYLLSTYCIISFGSWVVLQEEHGGSTVRLSWQPYL